MGSIVNGQLTVNLTARLVQLGIPVSFRQLVITAVTTGQTQSEEAGLNPAIRKQFASTIKKVINAAYGALTHGLDIALVASALLMMASAAVAYLTGTAERLDMVELSDEVAIA